MMGRVLIAEEKLVKDGDREGFYIVPGFNRYSINKEGTILARGSNRIIKSVIGSNGYPIVHMRDDIDNRTRNVPMHRALALTFLDYEHLLPYDGRIVVNHLDGNKMNYSLDNLEWTTDQGNITHACESGLRDIRTPISVRDVDTGEVTKWDNYSDYARHIGVLKDIVRYRIERSEKRVWPERKQYRKGHSDDPWYIPDDIEKALLMNSTQKSVLVKHLDTGAIIQYRKLIDASFALDVVPSVLTGWLKRKDQPILPGNVLIKYAEDETPWRHVENIRTDLNRVGTNVPIIIFDENTGVYSIYDSAKEAAIAKNVSIPTIHQRALLGMNKKFFDNCRYARLYDFIQETTVIPTSNSGLISSLTAGNSQ